MKGPRAILLLAAVASLGACGSRSYIDPDESGHEDTGGSYEDNHGTADCTEDCSGHDAGHQWAEDNQVQDADECDGNSESFNEGCRAYIDDNAHADDDSDVEGDDDRREE